MVTFCKSGCNALHLDALHYTAQQNLDLHCNALDNTVLLCTTLSNAAQRSTLLSVLSWAWLVVWDTDTAQLSV